MARGLTAKQKTALSMAKPADRAALAEKFRRDNNPVAPPTSAKKAKGQAKSNVQPKQARRLPSLVPPGVPNKRPKHYYDAFTNHCEDITLGTTVGPATPIYGTGLSVIPGSAPVTGTYQKLDASNTATSTTLDATNVKMVIFNPGSSSDLCGVVLAFKKDPQNAANVVCFVEKELKLKQFTDVLGPSVHSTHTHEEYGDGNGSAGGGNMLDPAGRVESIPTRGSIRIANTSERVALGGRVRMLRYNGSLRYWKDPAGSAALTAQRYQEPDVQTVLDLAEMVRSSDATSHYTGAELMVAHQMNTFPCDFVRSSTFSADESFAEALVWPRFSTIIMLIEDYFSSFGGGGLTVSGGKGNDYEVVTHVHRAGRFTPGSILHGKKQELLGDAHKANLHTGLESQKGSDATPVTPAPKT